MRLLFGEHRRYLSLGAAVDAFIRPALFPVVEISLCLFQTLEALAFEWGFLCVGDTRLDFSFSIGIAYTANHRRHAVVRQHIAIERVQTRIVDVGGKHAFAKIIQNDDARAAAKPAEGLLVQLGPDAGARSEAQQSNRFAAITQRHHEQPRAPVFARLRVAYHRTRAVIDLALFADLSFDNDPRFRRPGTAQFAHETLHALIAAREAVAVHQVLPDAHRVPAAPQLLRDPLAIRLTGACRALRRCFFREKAGGHLSGRF